MASSLTRTGGIIGAKPLDLNLWMMCWVRANSSMAPSFLR